MKKITFLCKRTLYSNVYTHELIGTTHDNVLKSIAVEMKMDDVEWTTNPFTGEDEREVVKEICRTPIS